MRRKSREVTYDTLGCEEKVDVQSALAGLTPEQVHPGPHFPKRPGDACSQSHCRPCSGDSPSSHRDAKAHFDHFNLDFVCVCVKRQVRESIGNIFNIKIMLVKIYRIPFQNT